MKDARTDLWHLVRGPLLAILGMAAAYGLSLLLPGSAWYWQAGLGAVAYIMTVTAAGALVRLDSETAVEESAAAIATAALTTVRVAVLLLVLVLTLIHLVGQPTT